MIKLFVGALCVFGSCLFAGDDFKSGMAALEKGEFQKAINIHNKLCIASDFRSCVILGSMHDGGYGVKQNKFKAAELYKLACDNGNPTGCDMLGEKYQNGEGVEKSFGKAAGLYKKACDSGDVRGCCNLGGMYHYGQFVKQDQ